MFSVLPYYTITNQEGSIKMKTLLHVNYHEGKGKLDEFFKIVNRFGYDGVELRAKYRFDDMDQAQFRKKAADFKADHPDKEIVFGHAVPFCRGTEEEIKENVDFFLDLMEWAKKECGTRVMNFFAGLVTTKGVSCNLETSGSGIALERDYERAAEGLKMIGQKAKELDMLIALEMHNSYLHDLAKPTKKLLDMVDCDAVGANYDHGNIVLNKNGEKVEEVFEILQDKIYYAHLKNVFTVAGGAGGYMITHLSDGCINQYEVMKGLKKYLKSGIFALEYPSRGDGLYGAKIDMEYIKFLKDELEID